MSVSGQARFFYDKTQFSYNRATTALDSEFNHAFTPYYDFTSHMKSFLHPLAHTAQFLRDACRLLQGAWFLVGALCTLNGSAIVDVSKGLVWQVVNMALEVVTAAVSVLSLASRLLSTIVNLSYESAPLVNLGKSLQGKEAGGRNADTTMNMLGGMFLGVGLSAMKADDEAYHAANFAFV